MSAQSIIVMFEFLDVSAFNNIVFLSLNPPPLGHAIACT